MVAAMDKVSIDGGIFISAFIGQCMSSPLPVSEGGND